MQALRGSGAKQGRSSLGEERARAPLGRAECRRPSSWAMGTVLSQTLRNSQQFILFLIKTFSRSPKEGVTQRNMKNIPQG